MKSKVRGVFIITVLHISATPIAFSVDKDSFYSSLSSKNMELINTQLGHVTSLSSPDKEAFEGTLLIKKSELVTDKKEKLNLFKNGRTKLESSISKNPQSCEYRFLRLIMQENTPEVLGYKKNIKEDCNFIKEQYNHQSERLKKQIVEYSKSSKNLEL